MSAQVPPQDSENNAAETDPLLELIGSGRDLWAK